MGIASYRIKLGDMVMGECEKLTIDHLARTVRLSRYALRIPWLDGRPLNIECLGPDGLPGYTFRFATSRILEQWPTHIIIEVEF